MPCVLVVPLGLLQRLWIQREDRNRQLRGWRYKMILSSLYSGKCGPCREHPSLYHEVGRREVRLAREGCASEQELEVVAFPRHHLR